MTSIIIPNRTSTNRFADYIQKVGGERRFRTHARLAQCMAIAVEHAAKAERMNPAEIIEGVLTSLVSAVQASAPESEWSEVGARLSDEMKRRLTVTGV